MLLCIVNESLPEGWSFSKIMQRPVLPTFFAESFVPLTKVRKGRGAQAAGFPSELRVTSRKDGMWKWWQGVQGSSEQSWAECIPSPTISGGCSENVMGGVSRCGHDFAPMTVPSPFLSSSSKVWAADWSAKPIFGRGWTGCVHESSHPSVCLWTCSFTCLGELRVSLHNVLLGSQTIPASSGQSSFQ